MAGKNTAVFGIYPDYASVERAVEALKDAGYRNTDISALFPENVGTKDFAHEKGTKAPEGATAGAGTGAVLGGTLGLACRDWLAGDSRCGSADCRRADRCRAGGRAWAVRWAA